MNIALLSSAITITSMIVFLGILYWAYARQNKARFEAIGKSILETDSDITEK